MIGPHPSAAGPDTTEPAEVPDGSHEGAFTPELFGEFRGNGALGIPNPMVEDEAAVHALAPVDDGWLAGGSITESPGPGRAALWHVGSDGRFAEPELLPDLVPGSPSFVRDVVVAGTDAVAVGRTGAGREAKATVWLAGGAGDRRAIELPNDFEQEIAGTTAERVLLLDDGTFMAVGRGEGPYFFWVLVWWSTDHGQTWRAQGPIVESYSEPLATTDGSRVLIMATDNPGRDGMMRHEVAVFNQTPDGPELEVLDQIDPMPGEGLHPQSLLWDGTQFVAAFDKYGSPVIATSVDGQNWAAASMTLPGLVPLAASVQALVMVDGIVEAFIEQSNALFVFQRINGDFLPVSLPDGASSAEMSFVEAHQPIASDGHRVGFLAATWSARSFIQWDGQAWSTRNVSELPSHRTGERLDIRQIKSARGSDMALMADEQLNTPGVFYAGLAGLLWRSAGHDEWGALVLGDHLFSPVSLGSWNGTFVVGDYNEVRNETQWWQFDPVKGQMWPLGTMPGFPRAVAGAADGLYVRVAGADPPAATSSGLKRAEPGESETTSLWFSADGIDWSPVDLIGENVSVCSDGTTAAATWATPRGDSDELGTVSLFHGRATPIGGAMTAGFAIVTEWRRVVRCAVGPTDVIATHLSYDRFLGTPTPSIEQTERGPRTLQNDNRLSPMLLSGATETWVEDITWDGREWIAVGHLSDFEVSMDAVIWRSTDGVNWDEGEVIAGGPGNQIAYSVTARDGEIIVGGLDGENAAIWRLPV